MIDSIKIRIEVITAYSEIAKVPELQKAVWQFDDASIVPSHLLLVAAHGCGLVLGAYTESRQLVGFSLCLFENEAIFGHDPEGPKLEADNKWSLRLHMIGVRPDARSKGVGHRLLLAQRERALTAGIREIVWTYDPLLTTNAYLYLHKLVGTTVRRYIPNMYGELSSSYYGKDEDPSDRYEVTWALDSDEPSRCHEAVALLEVDEDSSPALHLERLKEAVPCFSIEVPLDYLRLKESDAELGRRWRFAVREVSRDLFRSGFCIVTFGIRSKNHTGKLGEYRLQKL